MKNLSNMIHAIFFDGTSYFVDNVDLSVDSDTEIIIVSQDLEFCNYKCDELNESI